MKPIEIVPLLSTGVISYSWHKNGHLKYWRILISFVITVNINRKHVRPIRGSALVHIIQQNDSSLNTPYIILSIWITTNHTIISTDGFSWQKTNYVVSDPMPYHGPLVPCCSTLPAVLSSASLCVLATVGSTTSPSLVLLESIFLHECQTCFSTDTLHKGGGGRGGGSRLLAFLVVLFALATVAVSVALALTVLLHKEECKETGGLSPFMISTCFFVTSFYLSYYIMFFNL